MVSHQNLSYLRKSITKTACWETDKVGVFNKEGQICQKFSSSHWICPQAIIIPVIKDSCFKAKKFCTAQFS